MTMAHNLGNIEITDGQIRSALAQAAIQTGQANNALRFNQDSSELPALRQDTLAQYRALCDARAIRALVGGGWRPPRELRQHFDSLVERGLARRDDLTPGPGGFPRSFEHIRAEILAEERPMLNAMRMFTRRADVPLGPLTYTVRRSVVTGRAKWHVKGDAFPLSKAGFLEETFNTGYVVCAVERNFFEGLALSFANLQTYQIEAAGAIRAIEEFLNEVAWYGDSARNIYGALTYPHLAKYVVSTPFTSASTPDEIIAAVQTILHTAMIRSKSVFRPNRLAVSEAVHTQLSTRRVTDTSKTIKQFILENQDKLGIKDIEIAWELGNAEMTARGVGNPAGYDGVFAYHDHRDATGHVLIQPPTFLPVWRSGPLDTLDVAFASTGGMAMHNVGNNLLAFVRV